MDHRDKKTCSKSIQSLLNQLCELAVMRVNRLWKKRMNFLWHVIAIEPQESTDSIRSIVRTEE